LVSGHPAEAAAIRSAWLAYRETHERLGMDTVNEEGGRLVNDQCLPESTLIQMPAPDQAALL